ncbi:MAG TPA: hypothetical protein VGI45_03280 [Terracidiphilus sp.]|jgi:hypothetical protein
MIDPLGPDPTDPALPARQVGEIVPEIQLPEPPKPTRPKVRFANYDQPEALIRNVFDADPISAETKAVPVSEPPSAPPQPQIMSSKPVPVPAVSPQTALARPIPPLHKPTRFERALGVAKTVLPIVSKMLPLLEGNVVSAASNLLAPRPVEVNLKPIEEAISKLQSDQRALAFHTTEQKRALRRLQDEFDALQESVQKNAEQQAELVEHVAKLAKRTASFNRLIIILLVLSILFTAFLCVRIAYIIRF